MKKKYNIALRPRTKDQQVIELAHQFFHLANSYLLGPQSLPHVTLCHFHAEEKDLSTLWEKTIEAIKPEKIQLTFSKFSYNSYNKTMYWISLLPDHFAELKKWHLSIAEIIKEPVNRSYDLYDPHMTLLNTRHDSAHAIVQRVAEKFQPVTDEFYLALGATDEAGQFVETIFSRTLA